MLGAEGSWAFEGIAVEAEVVLTSGVRLILRKIVGDSMPGGFGPDENMCAGPHGRFLRQGAKGDVNEGSVPDHRIQQ